MIIESKDRKEMRIILTERENGKKV